MPSRRAQDGDDGGAAHHSSRSGLAGPSRARDQSLGADVHAIMVVYLVWGFV